MFWLRNKKNNFPVPFLSGGLDIALARSEGLDKPADSGRYARAVASPTKYGSRQ